MAMRPCNDSLKRGILMDGNLGSNKRPGYHRQNSIISRFDSLRRLYSENSYYDPYQQEQVQQQGKRKMMDDDDEQDNDEKQLHDRPTKRRKSFTSMVKTGVIQGVLFGSALALTAFDYLQVTPLKKSSSSSYSVADLDDNHWGRNNKNMRGHGVDFVSYFQLSPTFEKRMQKTEQLIRNICLDQQYALTRQFAPPPRASQDDRCWGIINKDDYDVNFTTMPSPKPAFTFIQKQKSFFKA
ncbi:hypothetical protein BC941DRAFT_465139 [Chlamydoabsidia padenii]|nr:hypothetical protein BC941DRAFT_465139 [Chlamydoabsidia padenii]